MVPVTVLAVAIGMLGRLPLNACKCAANASVCDSFIHSSAVFTGRVESIEPDLDFSGLSAKSKKWKELSETEIERLENDTSAQAVAKLKEIYSEIVPKSYQARLSSATTTREIEQIWNTIIEQGKRMRLRVQHWYKGPKTPTIDNGLTSAVARRISWKAKHISYMRPPALTGVWRLGHVRGPKG